MFQLNWKRSVFVPGYGNALYDVYVTEHRLK